MTAGDRRKCASLGGRIRTLASPTPVGALLAKSGGLDQTARMMANDAELLAAIQAAFEQVLPEARRVLSPTDELIDLGVGSVAALEMAGLLEDQFEVRFPEAELHELRTVGDFVALVQRSLRAPA